MYLVKAKEKSTKTFKMIITYVLLSQIFIFLRTKVLISNLDAFHLEKYSLAILSITYLIETIGTSALLAIVPALLKAKAEGGEEERLRLTNNILNITIIVSFIIVIFSNIFAGDIVKHFNSNLSGVELQSAIRLFRLGLPITFIILLKPIHLGYLQSKHGFKAGAKGGAIYNLIYVVYLLFFSRFGVAGYMIATLGAYLSYYIVMKDILKAFEYKYERVLNLKDKRILEFLVPLLIIIGFQLMKVNIFNVDKNLAINTFGSKGYLNNGIYILNLIITIFISILTTIAYPLLTEAFYEKKELEYRAILNKFVDLMVKTLVPISIILIIFAEPTINLFYGNGQLSILKGKILSPYELGMTINTFRYLAIGILFIGLDMIFVRGLFARGNYKAPLISLVAGFIFNQGLISILYRFLGEDGMALSMSLTAIFIGFTLIAELNREDLLDYKQFIKNIFDSSILGLLDSSIMYMSYSLLGKTDNAILISYLSGIFVFMVLNTKVKKTILNFKF